MIAWESFLVLFLALSHVAVTPGSESKRIASIHAATAWDTGASGIPSWRECCLLAMTATAVLLDTAVMSVYGIL